MKMTYTFKLNNKTSKESSASAEITTADSQNMPICMSGAGNQAFYCGLLDDNDSASETK